MKAVQYRRIYALQMETQKLDGQIYNQIFAARCCCGPDFAPPALSIQTAQWKFGAYITRRFPRLEPTTWWAGDIFMQWEFMVSHDLFILSEVQVDPFSPWREQWLITPAAMEAARVLVCHLLLAWRHSPVCRCDGYKGVATGQECSIQQYRVPGLKYLKSSSLNKGTYINTYMYVWMYRHAHTCMHMHVYMHMHTTIKKSM